LNAPHRSPSHKRIANSILWDNSISGTLGLQLTVNDLGGAGTWGRIIQYATSFDPCTQCTEISADFHGFCFTKSYPFFTGNQSNVAMVIAGLLMTDVTHGLFLIPFAANIAVLEPRRCEFTCAPRVFALNNNSAVYEAWLDRMLSMLRRHRSRSMPVSIVCAPKRD
jgi:hypothetical protein